MHSNVFYEQTKCFISPDLKEIKNRLDNEKQYAEGRDSICDYKLIRIDGVEIKDILETYKEQVKELS